MITVLKCPLDISPRIIFFYNYFIHYKEYDDILKSNFIKSASRTWTSQYLSIQA